MTFWSDQVFDDSLYIQYIEASQGVTWKTREYGLASCIAGLYRSMLPKFPKFPTLTRELHANISSISGL